MKSYRDARIVDRQSENIFELSWMFRLLLRSGQLFWDILPFQHMVSFNVKTADYFWGLHYKLLLRFPWKAARRSVISKLNQCLSKTPQNLLPRPHPSNCVSAGAYILTLKMGVQRTLTFIKPDSFSSLEPASHCLQKRIWSVFQSQKRTRSRTIWWNPWQTDFSSLKKFGVLSFDLVEFPFCWAR